MHYFILIISVALLISAAIIAGTIYVLVKVYKKYPRPYFFLLLFVVVTTPVALFKIHEHRVDVHNQQRMLSFIPDALQIEQIHCSKEQSWDAGWATFGGGGNEAGIIVYPLSESVSNEILKQGIEFFDNMPHNYKNFTNRDWRGKYRNWSETPITPDHYHVWKKAKEVGRDTGSLNIYDYICLYGFCIDIEPGIVAEANAIINSPGSYYAYGRIGLIVVSPIKKRVFYMYNG